MCVWVGGGGVYNSRDRQCVVIRYQVTRGYARIRCLVIQYEVSKDSTRESGTDRTV